MNLSIVVPAHNEENRIRPFLDAYLTFFTERYAGNFEMIVVVNASTDSTEEIVNNYREKYPQLKIMVEPRRVGKGGALVQGLHEAKGEYVGFVDADGATPPEAFQDLVDHIDNAGIIIASRWMKGASVKPRQPASRLLTSRMFNLLVRILFGMRLHDTQCGAKLMSAKALKAVMPHLGITRWAFDVDLLFQMRLAGYKIVEIPTTWHDVTGSKVDIVRASIEMFVAMVRLRLLFSPLQWIVRLYDRTLGRMVHMERLQRYPDAEQRRRKKRV